MKHLLRLFPVALVGLGFAAAPTARAADASVPAKLRQIQLPQLAFDGVPLAEAVKLLNEAAKTADPDKAGVRIESTVTDAVTIKTRAPMANVSLGTALAMLCASADKPLIYQIQADKVVILPRNAATIAAAKAVASGGAGGAGGDSRFSVGETVDDIEGEDLNGAKFKLSDYRGKVVVLDFWGDW
jgi:hypothetical protein